GFRCPISPFGGRCACQSRGGDSASASPPRSASRVLSLGSARPALISLLSFSTISAGVGFGGPTPDQVLASNSPIVGTSGSISERVAGGTCCRRDLPCLVCLI